MLDGTYRIALQSPMGMKRGTLTLHTQGARLGGILDILGSRNVITAGQCREEQGCFSGEIKTAVGSLHYEAEAQISGEQLTALAKTSKGNMKITGTRISDAEQQ